MEFIDLKAQYKKIEDRIQARIHSVLTEGKFIMGPEVAQLEQELSNFLDVKHSITCANGTDALQLALMALDIGPGDAVFTTPFTFFATAEVISLVGATPVFVDIDPKTYNIDPALLATTIAQTKAEGSLIPKAVIPVDLFGLSADYPAIKNVCDAEDIFIIQDAAQGFGAICKGNTTGALADIATTSFFPAKPLGCYGDGGAIFTNNDELADKLKSLRVHGKGHDKYDNIRIGLNSRLDTLQAAILIEKLEIYRKEIAQRNLISERYTKALSKTFTTPFVPNNYISVWAQYSLLASTPESRTEIMTKLKEADIPTAIYYAKPLHLQSAFKNLDYQCGDFPISEEIASRVFSLPMHPYLSNEEQSVICDALTRIAANSGR